MKKFKLPARLFHLAHRLCIQGACEHPMDAEIVTAMLGKLQAAGVVAFAPALEATEVEISLPVAELTALEMCLQVGGENDQTVSDADWAAIWGHLPGSLAVSRSGI